jgi:putative effector of murein hydrolase LrgA (UPF0299 family)
MGCYVLLLLVDIIYDAATNPSTLYLAIILVPLYIFAGIGIIRKWDSTRNILIVVAILMIAGTITSFGTAFFLTERSFSVSTRNLLRAVLGLAVSPFMLFYLQQRSVKSYFESSASANI